MSSALITSRHAQRVTAVKLSKPSAVTPGISGPSDSQEAGGNESGDPGLWVPYGLTEFTQLEDEPAIGFRVFAGHRDW